MHAEDNMILYTSTSDLIARIKAGFPEWKPMPPTSPYGAEAGSWATVTCQIGEFLRGLVDEWSFSDDLLPRLEHMRLLRECVARASRRLEAHTALSDSMTPEPFSELNVALHDRDARIADIYNSFSWRITAPLRKVAGLYLRLRGI
jgi:hypothetical protein